MLRISSLFLAALLAAGALARADALQEAEAALAEAQEVRAPEFAPTHYAKARDALAKAKETNDPADATAALQAAREAIQWAQDFARAFAALVDARDKMQLIEAAKYRAELVQRAEELFRKAAVHFEEGKLEMAKSDAKIAADMIHAAQVVAAREKFVRPVSKTIAAARRLKARQYAPKSFELAMQRMHALEKLVKNNPENQSEAYALSQRALVEAKRSLAIATLGDRFAKNPQEVERWIETEEARLNLIAKALGMGAFARDASSEAMVDAIQKRIAAIREGYEAQLKDAEAQIAELEKRITELSQRLAQYEGEMQQYQQQFAEMQELRRKLRIRREAEAKIKQIAAMFDPNDVEVLLTPEADVILRLKTLNFRSGSAVIPPDKYPLLDRVLDAMRIFPDRAVRIEGHTDSIGSAEFNQKLSERRAEAVRQYLLERLDAPRAIEAVGFGESRPIANNETPEGRRKNRRIDIIFLVPKAQAASEAGAGKRAESAL